MRNKFAKVSDPNKFVTDPGSPIHKLYSSKVLPNGQIDLIESGEEDIQEMIDSYRETTDMSFILHQLMLGDNSVVNVRSGAMYGDFTTAPQTLAEAQQMLIDGEQAFYQLPLDVRNKFDNDWLKWRMTAGSEDWIKNMSVVTGSSELENPVEDVNPAIEEKELV